MATGYGTVNLQGESTRERALESLHDRVIRKIQTPPGRYGHLWSMEATRTY
jgi:hypothetical protein